MHVTKRLSLVPPFGTAALTPSGLVPPRDASSNLGGRKSILYQQTSDHILESISTLALGIGRFRLALLIRILYIHEL